MFMDDDETKAQQDLQNEITKYSRAGVLSFLEQEWYAFQEEKAQWERERAAMIKHIKTLEAERNTHENLKRDLTRRIKMLEYALVQERIKYAQGEPRAAPLIDPATIEKYKQRRNALERPQKKNAILQKYLKEFEQSTEQLMLSVSSYAANSGISPSSLREKLALAAAAAGQSPGSIAPGSDAILSSASGLLQLPSTSSPSSTVNTLSPGGGEVFEIMEPQTEEGKRNEKRNDFETVQRRSASGVPLSASDKKKNLLAGIAALRKKPDDASAAEKSSKSGDSEKSEKQEKAKDQEKDKETTNNILTKSKERETSSLKRSSSSSSSSSASLISATPEQENEWMNKLPEHLRKKFGAASPSGSFNKSAVDGVAGKKQSSSGSSSPDSVGSISGTKEDSLGGLDGLESSLTAELPRESHGSPVVSIQRHKQWTGQFTLRHHLDVVRSVSFHQDEPILLSGSDDATVKLWNWRSAGTVGFSKPLVSADIEPVHTFLGHRGPVMSVAMASNKEKFFSAGTDTHIRMWELPDSSDTDPYAERGKAINFDLGVFKGHTDCIWELALHPHLNLLASASADATVRLWDFGSEEGEELKHTWYFGGGTGDSATWAGPVPTSVCFVPREMKQLVAAYNSSSLCLYDVETAACISQMHATPPPAGAAYPTPDLETQINKVVVHPTMPLAVTAHENNTIKFWDLRTSQMVHSTVAHQDPVSSVAIDPAGLYLVTAGLGCSLRFWEISSKHCVQEISAHRRKYDEGIYIVAYHPTQDLLASGGADAIIKVYS